MVIFQSAMGKRILIADDSVTIQKAFAMTLVGEDFAVTTARSADEGLTLARQTRPDLVIADASMPGRSGYELCAALKADAALRGIPVYILSSAHQPYDDAKGQQVGAEGNFVKPWESTAFIAGLKDAVSRPAGVPRLAAAASAAAATRPSAVIPAAALGDDFEVEVEPAPRDTAPAAPARSTAPSMPTVRPAAPPAGGMRPSLIPGVRPGAMPPARPGTSPSRTLGNTVPLGPSVPPRPAAGAQPMGRTLFGLPAASMPFPGSSRPASVAPAAHAPAPAPRAPAPAAPPPAAYAPPPAAYAPPPAVQAPEPYHAPEPVVARPAAPAHVSSALASASSLVDQKVASIAARGPEYEAIAKLSREVIEQIVWEIVPELADAIIREHVAKRQVG